MNLGAARLATEKAVFRPALPLSVLPAFTGGHMATRLTYKEQLAHPNWQRKRLEVLQRDEFSCQMCGDSESTLHVHHKQYLKGRMAWEYEADELVTLCEDCHEGMHTTSEALKQLIAKLPIDGPQSTSEALGVLAGWAHSIRGLDFTEQFNETPYPFRLGQLARFLDVWNMDAIWEMTEALVPLSREQKITAMRKFAADVKANPPEPAELPAGFQ
jgi:hypothetical protein